MLDVLIPSDSDKIDVLFKTVQKIENIREDLNDAVFGFMPFSNDRDWEAQAEKVFWNSSAMSEFLQLEHLLKMALECANQTIHQLEHSTHAEVAY